jgi:hypothetical protein
MTAAARTIPVCPDCFGDLHVELIDFWCPACSHVVPFEWAMFIEGNPDD